MTNAMSHRPSAPASKAARSFTRFVRTSVRPVVFKLSRKLSVIYWPGRRRSISAMLLALLSGFVPGLAGAGPTGGEVVAGTAKLLKPTGTTTQINQSSQNVIINWQSFSIGANEAVRFVQPSASAVALNRVIGSDPSRIFGSLQANGKVFLVNNAGVYFAPGASVDVGGLVATSMNIGNASFMSGKYKFEAGANAGAVTNDGQLRGAFVVLAAPQVSNGGSIVTTGGATALAAGGRVSLDIAGDKLVTMSVDAATANAAVVNSGSVSADGGKVFMSASSANAVLDTVINTSGIVRAGSISQRNGQIVIDGGAAGVVKVDGTLAASGAGTGLGGGAVKVLGEQVALLNGARIDVSGDTGGGSALVGGDLHGAGGVKTAATARVEAGAVINADALASGNGGKVVVWADQHTAFGGAISARGGAQGGDGGFVETSGKATLAFAGKVDTSAKRGATGSLLLDPTDITIDTTASSGGIAVAGGTFGATAASSTLNVGDLTTALASTNVIVDTASAGAGSGHIVVATDVGWSSTNSLTLKASGDITNNAQITSNGGAIKLYADGNVAVGTLNSGGGAIAVAGNAGGSSRAASVIGGHILSAGGNVSINSNGPVTTGEINVGSGTILVTSNAGVGIDAALSSSNTGDSAITVQAGAGNAAGIAGGGDITVGGAGSVSASGGRATLYTGSIAGSTGVTDVAGAGSGRFRYNSAPGADNFSAPLGSGVQVVYREQPTLTITGFSPTITYGDADPALGFDSAGLQNGDSFLQALTAPVTVTAGLVLSGSGHANADTYAVAPSGGPDQLGYNVVYANGTLTVNKKTLTATVSAPDKVYDGTTTATPTLTVNGLVDAETLGVSATAAFDSKDVAIASQVTVNSVALADGALGGVASNYTLGAGQTATAHITPKALTVTLSAPDKVYDGNADASGSLAVASGLVGTETLGVSGASTFNSKDVLSANLVTVQSLALADGANGGLASNYSAGAGQTTTAHITPKALTANAAAADKIYDGSTVAAPAVSIASGLVGAESVSVTGTGVFNSKDVLAANQVTVQSVALADGANGGLASNYSLDAGQTATAHITPKALTASAAAPDKVYDGSVVSAPTISIDSGLVGAETVSASGSATFNSKDVLTANEVTVQSVTLADGADGAGGLASNYSLAAGQTTTAHITPRALTVSVNAPDKVYDGSTDAAGTLAIASGLVGSETLAVSGTSTFNSKDVLSANLVTVQSLALADGANGGLASNYSAGTGQTTGAHITPKSLTATAAAADKVYDGGVAASAVMHIDAAGLVGAETVTGTGSGVFDSKDVAAAGVVTVQSVALADGANGGLASNYSLATGQTVTAHITPNSLTASMSATDKVYDGSTAAAPTLAISAGLVGTEQLGVTGSATFNSKDVLSANLVTVDAVALADGANGGLASNYSLGSGQSATAHITPKVLGATAAAPDKAYDGSLLAAPTVTIASGLVGAETLNASATGAFNSKDVLAANLVTVQSVALANGASGGLASNYSLAAGQTATAHITPKALTASATAADKVYNGSLGATAVMNIAAAGLVGAETVTGTGTGVFNSKDVLAANLVTVQAVTLANGANGGLASNYRLGTGQTAVAHITRKALTATATAANKVYDGNLVAAPVLTVASGLVGAETLSVSAAGTFNSKDVLTANQVTVNSATLANGANGGIASNYSLAAGQTAGAHVTPKALSATVAASGKVYDGSVTASNVLTIASGLVGAETVTASGSAVFNSKDVLTANQVTVQAAQLANGANGGLASNYSLAPGQVASNVHITARPLTAVAAAASKVYDGNLAGKAVMNIIAGGLVGGETVSATGTGLFNSKDVGSAATVTVNAVQLANGANGGLASNYSLGTGQVGAATITRRPSVTWVGGATGNWADAANWEAGAIPDFANVANVIIPAGKSVTFNTSVPSQKGVVRIDGLDGGGALVVGSGTLNVANALKIGSYAQSAGEVDAGALSAGASFNQTGGKLAVTGNVDIVQAAGSASLADLSAARLSIGGGATQAAGTALLVSDTLTLDSGAADVVLANQNNDFGKVVIASAHDVTLRDIDGLDVRGKVGGNFIASAPVGISQSGALDVAGATILDTAGTLRLDDKQNALRGRVKVNAGGDVLLASAAGLAIGGDVGGNLQLATSGPVTQTTGDALHVAGTSSIGAGANAVTLTEADNHFTGPLSVTGGALSVVDKGALALGQSSVGSLAISSGGALTQTGKLAVTGASAIAAQGQVVTLGDAGNTFGGKITLGAASATVNAAGPLALDSDVDGSLTLGSPDLKLTAANALNLHLNTGAASISASKAIVIDGSSTGPLAISAGGAVTQSGALTAGGTTSISAPGQAITLTNAGNDFGGELSLTGAAVQVTDKNALLLGSGDVKGNLQLTANGDIGQKGVLTVSGATAIESTGAVALGNEANDFAGPVSATATSVLLKDKNVLTLARVTASKAELSAGSELQVAPGGIVDAPDIALSLSPVAVKGAIGTPANKFEVRKGARVVLGANSPAVPTYIGGDGAQVVVGNLAANINYSNEAWSMDARTRVNSSIANILQASQKKADSNVVLIERGLLTDLTMPIPYPHEGAMRTKGPACIGNAADCPAEP